MFGRQQSDGECAARRAAAKTRTADVAATGYPPSDEVYAVYGPQYADGIMRKAH